MHKLPDLPYDYNALEPVISAEIMQVQKYTVYNVYIYQIKQYIIMFLHLFIQVSRFYILLDSSQQASCYICNQPKCC